MSLTNDQITAQNFKDFYEGIRPYLNGQVPTFANAFNKSDLYSTDEKIVGCWTDGKPLYQKTIVDTMPTITTDGVRATKIIQLDSDIDFVCDIRGIVERTNGTIAVIPEYYGSTANTFAMLTSQLVDGRRTLFIGASLVNDSDMPCWITIQYTKTTDTAIKVGDGNDYSTDEQIIGTWIDGKPLYQKTFTGTTTSGDENIAHNIDNIDKIANVFGFCSLYSSSTGLTSYMPSGFYKSNGAYFSVLATETQYSIRQSHYDNCPYVITIQYTKTTD